jgi:hypothetical protein
MKGQNRHRLQRSYPMADRDVNITMAEESRRSAELPIKRGIEMSFDLRAMPGLIRARTRQSYPLMKPVEKRAWHLRLSALGNCRVELPAVGRIRQPGNSVGNLPRRFTGLVCILQLFFWLLHPCPH